MCERALCAPSRGLLPSRIIARRRHLLHGAQGKVEMDFLGRQEKGVKKMLHIESDISFWI